MIRERTGYRRGLLGLMSVVKGQWSRILVAALSGLAAQGGTVASAVVGAWLVGRVLAGASPQALEQGLVALGVCVAVAAVARWWQSHVSHDLAFSLIETLQVGLYDGLERAAPAHILGQRIGDIASTATVDAELTERFYAHILADYVGAVLVPLTALIGLFLIEPILALVVLPFLPLVGSVPVWLSRRAERQGRNVMEALGHLSADTVDLIQGQRELALFGRGRDALERLMTRTQTLGRAQRRYGLRSGLEQAAVDGLAALTVLAAAVTAAILISVGRLEIGWFPVAVVMTGAALTPLVEVTLTARQLSEVRAGADRILAIVHHPEHIADTGQEPPPRDTTLAFKDVRFSYAGDGRRSVLNGLTCAVRPGEMVALVGRSGAGKSTCATLLLRFWDVEAGRITIGGLDIRDMPLATLRRLVSYVPQDVSLFNETIADNIRLGVPDASMADIEAAARRAQIHDFVTALPEGYNTLCGEGGQRLSGGQRQRLAIARALLVKAPILILDEASSNLDGENDWAIGQVLDEMRRSHTILCIAHRLATIRRADRIIVLDGGNIVETGTHDALLASRGAYARLIASPDRAGGL